MNFSIRNYLNSLSSDVTVINVSNKNLTYLPDLSRFHSLEELYCNDNELIELPRLNPSLKKLFCCKNQLTSLPPLNEKLEILYCNINKITQLPPLNPNLETLYCSNNGLTSLPPLSKSLIKLFCFNNELVSLPPLNKKLEILYCFNNELACMPLLNDKLEIIYFVANPIYYIIANISTDYGSNNIAYIKQKVKILYNFKHSYYSLKFKNKFRDWLWVKVREPKIQEYYSPNNLVKLLSKIDEDDFEQFDNALSNW